MGAELIRVYTRLRGKTSADVTIPYETDFQIVVEAEVSAGTHSTGGQYEIGVLLTNLTHSYTTMATPQAVSPTPASGASANFGDASWKEPGFVQFVYDVPQLGRGDEDHLFEVITWLRVGLAEPEVHFAKGPMFICTRK